MKIGTENRTKTIIAAALLLVAGFLVMRAFHSGDEEPSAAQSPAADVHSLPSRSDRATCSRRHKDRA